MRLKKIHDQISYELYDQQIRDKTWRYTSLNIWYKVNGQIWFKAFNTSYLQVSQRVKERLGDET